MTFSVDLDIENFIPPEAMSPLTIGGASGPTPVRDVTPQRRALSPGEVSRHAYTAADGEGSMDVGAQQTADIGSNDDVASKHGGRASATPSRGAYENLQPGEQYELRLVKVNNSLGLNIAVSVRDVTSRSTTASV